ncbi:MAG: hypothetical protein PSX80_00640 [bacterium]|nr:hypothetical protein [bacterium]
MSSKEMVRWEKIRAKGKWYFMLRTALQFSLAVLFADVVTDWLFGDPIEIKTFTLYAVPVFGLLSGITLWWIADARYQNHMLDSKIHDGLKDARS